MNAIWRIACVKNLVSVALPSSCNSGHVAGKIDTLLNRLPATAKHSPMYEGNWQSPVSLILSTKYIARIVDICNKHPQKVCNYSVGASIRTPLLRGCVKNAHLRSNRVKRSGPTGQRKLLFTPSLIPSCVQEYQSHRGSI